MKAFTVLAAALGLANVDLSTGKVLCTCSVTCFTWNQTLPLLITDLYGANPQWPNEPYGNYLYFQDPTTGDGGGAVYVDTITVGKDIAIGRIEGFATEEVGFGVEQCSDETSSYQNGFDASRGVPGLSYDSVDIGATCFDVNGTKVLGVNMTRSFTYELPDSVDESRVFSYVENKVLRSDGLCSNSSKLSA
eukprot:CAMPEP_0203768034 /NCGR_PEP_ID=MMETSP0099_2-20121227/1346_1 /ASSEMBLY_ACC=CAM_ASM_000209 /TAXON_ID=96639 /ORGANISM=" , Strain NY0313808BC1" /LENGTH=190 /DNA_ID=CAMNT_0050664645 /DNA_START=413 /DNA_END=982 /DNA_ORIENTATION=-